MSEMKPKEEWLKEYSKENTIRKHSQNFDEFCQWANTNDIKLVEEYKTSDPREFSKKWGKKILQYYNSFIEKGSKINTARTKTIAPRAFFKSQCIEVKIKRGRIAQAQIAMGEHEFILKEFQKMYQVGNIEDKARLATAISLGWGAYDFVHLEWSFIEPYLAENLELPVAFWFERKKTGAPSRSHLTHESVEALRMLRDITPKSSQYVFSGRNGKNLTEDALNDWLKSLIRRAKIQTRGKIRFHLVRKFLMSQLSASGMNQWETKLAVGKSIPSDILTYLKDQAQNLREKFMNAESRFALSGLTNANHSKLDVINGKVEEMENIISEQQIEIGELKTKIEAVTNTLTRKTKELKKELDTLKEIMNLDKQTKYPENGEDIFPKTHKETQAES